MQRTGRNNELVALLTDLPPQELDASQWLEANRQCRGENNLAKAMR